MPHKKMAKNHVKSSVNWVKTRLIDLWNFGSGETMHTMDAVYSGALGINQAALEYGIPPTTLKDLITGRVVHGTKMGAKPYLTNQEEQELVDFLINCSKMGFRKTRKDMML